MTDTSRSCLAIAAAIAAVALVPSRGAAWCQMTTLNERPPPDACLVPMPPDSHYLEWWTPCTSISLSTHGSTSLEADDVRRILRASIDTWTTVDCGGGRTPGLSVEVLDETNQCSAASHFTGDPNVHSVIFVQEGWVDPRHHSPEAFAVTLVWHDPDSGEIWDVDMEINEELSQLDAGAVYGDCSGLDVCPNGVVDLQNVLTHEMGHYFGIAHTPHDVLATMYAEAESNETLKRTLQPDDVEAICTIYEEGHFEGATCDPTPRGGLNLACDPGCGCGVAGVPADRPTGAGLALLALAIAVLAGRRARW